MMRKYGRKKPLPLPAHRMLSMVSSVLPPTVDLREFCGPIKDQGAEGSCTAHAGTSANEWIHRKYLGNKTVVFSPAYTYSKELIVDGTFPQDAGSDGVTLCGTLVANGCCELAKFPYIPGTITVPTSEQDADARLFALGAYHGLVSAQVAMSVLADPTPWPVEIGFTVYQSFESNQTSKTGVYNPQPGEQDLGGHEVLMVGYDNGINPTLRPKDSPPSALIQNSWGASWGLKGFFWMALTVLDSPDTDLKIVHSGHPW
jgi:hypothetical protein